jgi:hypothetical protein
MYQPCVVSLMKHKCVHLLVVLTFLDCRASFPVGDGFISMATHIIFRVCDSSHLDMETTMSAPHIFSKGIIINFYS